MSDDDLSVLWQQQWPGCPPLADTLKHAYRDRWLRFHSLPESKRYPDHDAEYKIVLHAVADDATSGVMITSLSFDRIHHPYDGGSDVLLATTIERDAMKHRHADWLSDYPLGY